MVAVAEISTDHRALRALSTDSPRDRTIGLFIRRLQTHPN